MPYKLQNFIQIHIMSTTIMIVKVLSLSQSWTNYHDSKQLSHYCPALVLTIFIFFTINGKRFAGLDICGFSAIKVFMEILLRCLVHKCSLFSTVKERGLYSRKNFCGTPENCEKHESLAQ